MSDVEDEGSSIRDAMQRYFSTSGSPTNKSPARNRLDTEDIPEVKEGDEEEVFEQKKESS